MAIESSTTNTWNWYGNYNNWVKESHFKIIEELSEYNSNTSAQHPTYNDEDDDIVWPIWKHIES